MKKIIFAGFVLFGVSGAYAQTASVGDKWENKTERVNSETTADGDFSKTSIKMHNRKLVFSNLPQLSKSAIVTITNNDGESVLRGKVNPVENAVDLRYLEKGTYFIHLTYKSEDKKGFVLNL